MALSGNELIYVVPIQENGQPGALLEQTTTGAISALATAEALSVISTSITTVGNGTLTAAGLVGGQISRSGPTGAYTDTTDTATNIVAALPAFVSGAVFLVRLKNATAFVQTLAAGTGVTLPTTVIIGPFQVGNYFATLGGTSGSPTVTLSHMSTTAIGDSSSLSAPLATALATVGAGTLTAAIMNGGIAQRTGAQTNTAFTDTTDTAANIVAGNPGLIGKVGSSFLFLYQNQTNATATLTGGSNVTVSGITAVPAGTWALYLVTYSALTPAVTMVGVASSPPVSATGTFVANGVSTVTVANSEVTANSSIVFTLKTVGGTVGSYPEIKTITPGTGFTLVCTASDTSTYNYLIIG